MKKSLLIKPNAPDFGVKSLTLAGLFAASLVAPVVAWGSSPVLKNDSYATSASATVHGTEAAILINPTNTGYLQYGMGASLPTGVTGQDIDKATLKIYVSSVSAIGTLTVRKVTSAWNEATLSGTLLPTLDATAKTFAIGNNFAGKFVQLDVTDLAKSWADPLQPTTDSL